MAVPVELTWSEVVARRLDRHGLTTPAVGVTDAVRAMVGAHAQVMSAAEVSIGLRTGATVAAVKAAVADGTLVKTFGPRGTVHLLPSVDLGMWLGALSSLPTSSSLPASARLTDSQRDLVVATLAMILSELPLTADELDAEVVSATGAWAGDPVVPAFGGYWPRWRQAIATAAHAGIVAYGPNRGQKSTYVRAPRVDVPEKADLLLLHDYLYSYGPATAKDFAQWLAVPVRWTTAVFDRATLTAVVVDGREAWVNEGDVGTPDQTVSSVLLLPYFDPYVVGSQPRAWLFAGMAVERALGRGQAGVHPVVLIDGVVAGVWHQKRSGSRLTVTVEPFVDLPVRSLRAVEEQGQRLGMIQEAVVELVIGTVSTGAHA